MKMIRLIISLCFISGCLFGCAHEIPWQDASFLQENEPSKLPAVQESAKPGNTSAVNSSPSEIVPSEGQNIHDNGSSSSETDGNPGETQTDGHEIEENPPASSETDGNPSETQTDGHEIEGNPSASSETDGNPSETQTDGHEIEGNPPASSETDGNPSETQTDGQNMDGGNPETSGQSGPADSHGPSETDGEHPVHAWAQPIEMEGLSNLYQVSDDLYRSAQPDLIGFKNAEIMGIKTILSVRLLELDTSILKDAQHSLNLIHISMLPVAITDENIRQLVDVLRTAPKPILVHCLHGSDRTGFVVALYRILFQNWTKDEAKDELINGGFGYHEEFAEILNAIDRLDIEAYAGKD